VRPGWQLAPHRKIKVCRPGKFGAGFLPDFKAYKTVPSKIAELNGDLEAGRGDARKDDEDPVAVNWAVDSGNHVEDEGDDGAEAALSANFPEKPSIRQGELEQGDDDPLEGSRPLHAVPREADELFKRKRDRLGPAIDRKDANKCQTEADHLGSRHRHAILNLGKTGDPPIHPLELTQAVIVGALDSTSRRRRWVKRCKLTMPGGLAIPIEGIEEVDNGTNLPFLVRVLHITATMLEPFDQNDPTVRTVIGIAWQKLGRQLLNKGVFGEADRCNRKLLLEVVYGSSIIATRFDTGPECFILGRIVFYPPVRLPGKPEDDSNERTEHDERRRNSCPRSYKGWLAGLCLVGQTQPL
jgi:hypothetical protein